MGRAALPAWAGPWAVPGGSWALPRPAVREDRWVRLFLWLAGEPGAGDAPASPLPAEDPDRGLVLDVLATYPHDTGPYSRLVHRHWNRVWTICQGILVNAEDADEAAQDAFLKVHRYLPDFRFDSRFSTWLHRVAVNAALNLLAARRRRLAAIERVARDALLLSRWRPRADPDPARRREDVRAALDALDPLDRAIVVLHALEGISYQELAQVFDLTSGAVRMRAMRARERLRGLIGELHVD